jgi:hypothetical protein
MGPTLSFFMISAASLADSPGRQQTGSGVMMSLHFIGSTPVVQEARLIKRA